MVIRSAGPERSPYPQLASARCPRDTCGHDFLVQLPWTDEEAAVFEIRSWVAQRRRGCLRDARSFVLIATCGFWCFPLRHLHERLIVVAFLELNAQSALYVASRLHRIKGAVVPLPGAYHIAALAAPLVAGFVVGLILALCRVGLALRATRAIARGRTRIQLVALGEPYR